MCFFVVFLGRWRLILIYFLSFLLRLFGRFYLASYSTCGLLSSLSSFTKSSLFYAFSMLFLFSFGFLNICISCSFCSIFAFFSRNSYIIFSFYSSARCWVTFRFFWIDLVLFLAYSSFSLGPPTYLK